MGAHYQRTRKQRCIARITALIERAKEHREDLTEWKHRYGGKDAKIAELLPRLETIGYKSLLKLNWALESHAAALGEWKEVLIQRIIFEAGRQGLTPEDVLILVGQQFPGEEFHYRRGGVDLEWEQKLLNNSAGADNPWRFLDNLYRKQLAEFYQDAIQPRPQAQE